jgi:hypothetical protein
MMDQSGHKSIDTLRLRGLPSTQGSTMPKTRLETTMWPALASSQRREAPLVTRPIAA